MSRVWRTGSGASVLLIARAIQGLAAGVVFATCTAFPVDAAQTGRRGRVGAGLDQPSAE